MTTLTYQPTQDLATDRPYAVEYYYRIRWGSVAQFLELFRKNHYPVLVRQLRTGRILEIRSEQPRFHSSEADRWDLRVTLVFKNVVAAHDSAHEAALLLEMYPDQDTFRREEQRRFELMLGHWDIPLSPIDLRMTDLLHELLLNRAAAVPDPVALRHKDACLQYGELGEQVERCARGLMSLGLKAHDRVAVYLPKQFETVIAFFAAARAGGAFVPVNPLLKAPQVEHILTDCGVRIFVTSSDRLSALGDVLSRCPELRHVVLVGEATGALPELPAGLNVVQWSELLDASASSGGHDVIDMDIAAILYTSGSTGKPKGVVLSHRNIVTGAHSVARYLGNTAQDRLLAVLPFSFDYGFSQLTTAFSVGASVTLMDYLFARDILKLLERERITGLAGVPPLWVQLADLPWPQEACETLRYITNSGGAMPRATLVKLRAALTKTRVFLMYGLTEAFRSTYLDPAEVDRRPDSIGKAIPNAEILVVRPDGSPCEADEPGELVHRGSLVALGYWNDPVKTAARFKPVPGQDQNLVLTEMAVWSGDTVRRDAEGFLYFVGRRDEMIKTSGYRVSPTEVEEAIFATGLVTDAAALGIAHPVLGQAIVVVATPAPEHAANTEQLLKACRAQLPAFMVPMHIEWREALPRNANGKYDRPTLAAELKDLFVQGTA